MREPGSPFATSIHIMRLFEILKFNITLPIFRVAAIKIGVHCTSQYVTYTKVRLMPYLPNS